jgi:hypothetical protein
MPEVGKNRAGWTAMPAFASHEKLCGTKGSIPASQQIALQYFLIMPIPEAKKIMLYLEKF